jgi:hypothetical protein
MEIDSAASRQRISMAMMDDADEVSGSGFAGM